MRLGIHLLVWSLFIACSAQANHCPSNSTIDEPPVFTWTHHPASGGNPEYYSGTLEYGEYTLTTASGTLNTRAYRQEGGQFSVPGPTLNMVPGNKYVLRYRNLLQYQAPNPDHNIQKDPDISNLHTHGLHISGETPGDDVTRMFEGGYGGDYVYDIPTDHMGGTYWYHAHHHGSTFLQVSTGGFGLIVIDDSNDGIPASVAAMQERQVIVGFLDPAAAGTGGDTLISGTLSATWTVNGVVTGDFCVPSGEWQHWRMLLADRDARLKTVSIGSPCEVQLLARDGVWRTSAPKALPTNSIELTGASRADLAVRCNGDTTLAVDNTVVANIHIDGAGDTAPHPFATDGLSQWSATRPDYLRDLRGETPNNTETVRMGARTINGAKFDKNTATFTLDATMDGLQEWGLNGARNHPFHLHIYHVQTTEECGPFEAGEYYDVVANNCKLRFDLDNATSTVYAGRTIMHCHILEHEDQGAMGWLDVQNGEYGPPQFPTGAGFSAYYQIAGPPPAASDVLVGSITVSTVNADKGLKHGRADIVVVDDLGNPVDSATVAGFFQGSINEAQTGLLTDSFGQTSTVSSTTAKGKITLDFCVMEISHPTLNNFTGEVCSSL